MHDTPPQHARAYWAPGNASALKPLLVTADGYNCSSAAARAAGWWHEHENTNDVFFNQLHSIDLRLGANPGATGVLWHPAQGTSVRDMAIDAQGAFSGLDYGPAMGYGGLDGHAAGAGGGGTLEGIRTLGGRYGLRGGGSQWMLRSIEVANASVAGWLMDTGSWNNAALDVKISGCPTALNVSQARNNVVLLDSVLTVPPGGTGLSLYDISPNETGIVFDRVTIAGGEFAVRGATAATSVKQPSVGGSTDFRAWRSGGYEYTDGVEAIDGATGRPAVFGMLKATRPDKPLPLRSKPRVARAFNVKTAGAVGDCKHDDTAALTRALAAHDVVRSLSRRSPSCVSPAWRPVALPSSVCQRHNAGFDRPPQQVFLPATQGQNGGEPSEGCYLVSDTLVLRSNATLLGEGLSLIKIAPRAAGFGDKASPKPLLRVQDDAFSRACLMDLMLDVSFPPYA